MQENVLIMEIATKKMIAIALTIVVSTTSVATLRTTLARINHITKANAPITMVARVNKVMGQMALAIAYHTVDGMTTVAKFFQRTGKMVTHNSLIMSMMCEAIQFKMQKIHAP